MANKSSLKTDFLLSALSTLNFKLGRIIPHITSSHIEYFEIRLSSLINTDGFPPFCYYYVTKVIWTVNLIRWKINFSYFDYKMAK